MKSPEERPPRCTEKVIGSFWSGTLFSLGVLPMQESKSIDSSEKVPPTSFLEYLTQDLIHPLRQSREDCRDSWAFAVSRCLQYATALAYKRMGLQFDNLYMAEDYLLSCYEVGPMQMCGCLGDDLPNVMKNVSERGIVTASQFPYLTSTFLSMELFGKIDSVYYCTKENHLGTCAPCEETLQDYTETTLSASPDEGSYRFTVSCMPCVQPKAPKYFPKEPFHIYAGPNPSAQEQAIAVQKELVRTGPLCAALAVDAEAFTTLLSGGKAPVVTRASQGLFYRPHHITDANTYRTVLIVGYVGQRTSDDGPSFWICEAHMGSSDFGYTLQVGTKVLKNLFNIELYDQVSRILENVVSFEKIQVLTDPSSSPHDLRSDDPLVAPMKTIIESQRSIAPSTRVSEPPQSPSKEKVWTKNARPWVAVLMMIIAVIVLYLFWAQQTR